MNKQRGAAFQHNAPVPRRVEDEDVADLHKPRER